MLIQRFALFLIAGLLIAGLLIAGSPIASAQAAPQVDPQPKPQTLDELLLFFPSKFPEGDWKPAELDFQDVTFEAEDKTKLHGWYCVSEKPRAVILIAHGNAGHVASRAGWLRYLQQKAHCSVFMFDYRGYGRSEGKPTVKGILQDAQAARAKLCELAAVKNSEIVLMGESLGGAVVVELAKQSGPRALILQSTFTSMRDLAEVHFPQLSWLVAKSKLNSVAAISAYHGPLLQSHGTADQTIPFTQGERLFSAANDPKTFVRLEGLEHNNWLNEAYLKRLDEFLEALGK